jgi:hypothetical protein
VRLRKKCGYKHNPRDKIGNLWSRGHIIYYHVIFRGPYAARIAEMRASDILVGTCEKKRPISKYRPRLQDNIRVDLNKTVCLLTRFM